MAIKIDGTAIDAYILPPETDLEYRARSVMYALNGDVHEDRLGEPKKLLTLTFPRCPSTVWEPLKNKLKQKEIPVTGGVGSMSVEGTYHLKDNRIPTATDVVIGGVYYSSVTVTLEEV